MRPKWMLPVLIGLTLGCMGGWALGQTRPAADTSQMVPVTLTIRAIGRTEFDILTRGSQVYVPVVTLFKFLRLNYNYNSVSGVLDGFYIRPDNPYRIDAGAPSASVGGKRPSIAPNDLVVRPADLYLRIELFESLFGLQLKYNPRRLDITLSTKEALPIFLERDREYARRRKFLLGKIPLAEYTLPRQVSAFGVGRLDYSFSSQEAQHGIPRQDYSLRLGNQFLYGDLDTRFDGFSHHTPTWNDVTSRLQYAFLDNSLVRQVNLGDIITTGLVPSSVFGAEITNRPAPRRLLFVTENIEGQLQTGELSDLYYGGSLIDFQAGTASGHYNFPTLITYGVTNYTVKKYDQFGVEYDLDYRIVVPPTMIPPGEVQYSLAGGEMRLLNDEWYGNGVIQWGVNDALTVGTGVDYYSPTSFTVNRKFHPLFTTTARITGSLIGDFTYAPTAYSTAQLSLSYPTSAGGSLTYSWFARNVFYNPRNITDEGTATINIPLRIGASRLGLDFLGRQTIFSSGRERIFQVSLGGQVGIFTPRITHRRSYDVNPAGETVLDAFTSVSLGIRAPGGFLLRGQTRYFHTDGGFRDLRLDFSRRVTREFWLDVFYDRAFETNQTLAGVEFSYYLPFSVFRGVVATGGESGFRASQSITGSIGYSAASNHFFFDYLNSRVGFGGLIVQPFVDANGNGLRDPGEEIITKARIRSSSLFGNQYLRYTPGLGFGLQHTLPYEEYVMSIEPQTLDNPLWVPRYVNVAAFSEPNQFSQVNLPIVVGGIVRGKIEITGEKKILPAEGLNVTLRAENAPADEKAFSLTAISYSTGEFEFIGVPPGSYRVSLEPTQITQQGFVAKELFRVIEVHATAEGDEVAGVDFTLTR